MALKRTRAQATRPRKKRVMNRKRRVPRGLRTSIVTCKRQFRHSFWQPSTAATLDFWKIFWFKLNDLPSSAEFTALFDEYRINGIKVVFRPRFDNFSGNDTTDTTLPGVTNQSGVNLHICKDPRGVISPSGVYGPSTLNAMFEHDNIRSYNGNKAISVYYKPTVVNTVDGSAAKYTYAPWLSTAYPGLNHFGFSAFAQDINFSGTFGQSWDIFVTYYMQFRGMK